MTKQIKHLKYLDDILDFLVNKAYAKARIEEIEKHMSDKEIHVENSNYAKVKFEEAMDYLVEIGLVSKDVIGNTQIPLYTLTFKGQIKSTAGFVFEFEKEIIESELRRRQLTTSIELSKMQKWTIWLAVVLSGAAFSVSLATFLYKNENSKNNSAKCVKDNNLKPKVLSRGNIKVKGSF